ncbi:hypothetical protein NL676_035107 [Syzygium grande]|nr:hypothetical protein NL676_035107 [Syzygium grande]
MAEPIAAHLAAVPAMCRPSSPSSAWPRGRAPGRGRQLRRHVAEPLGRAVSRRVHRCLDRPFWPLCRFFLGQNLGK